jgi:hypothetical protein
LRREPTGVATCFNADVVATAKRDLKPGEMLDGEGGYTVFGKLLPARKSLAVGGLPLGLAHNLKLARPVAKDQSLSWADVMVDESLPAYRMRTPRGQAARPGGVVQPLHDPDLPGRAGVRAIGLVTPVPLVPGRPLFLDGKVRLVKDLTDLDHVALVGGAPLCPFHEVFL